jgi:signal transduction histidine kinase
MERTKRSRPISAQHAARNGDGRRFHAAVLDFNEREQRRIGKDLHDGLCQELVGIALLAKTMHHRASSGEAISEQAAAEVAALVQGAVRHARAIARGLHPVDSLPAGLTEALRLLAADTAAMFSLSCQFRCHGPMELRDQPAATHLYRIAQECVRYAVHQAKARQIVIALSCKRGRIELTVTYDAIRRQSPRSFVADTAHEMIRHRARIIDGRIAIRRLKGGGMRVTCQVPDIKAA